MNRLMTFMFKMPVGLMASGLELIARTLREFQDVVSDTADLFVQPTSRQDLAIHSPWQSIAVESRSDSFTNRSSQVQESELMYDDCEDLNADDLKEVRYTIRFRKRDFEALLQTEREEVIDYPLSTFCNLKVSEFLTHLREEGMNVPSNWRNGNHPRHPGYRYEPEQGDSKTRFFDIPADHQKWLVCDARVSRPLDRAEKAYDKDQARAQEDIVQTLRDIRDDIRGIGNNIGQ